jgi:hypothetical protein
MNYFTNIRECNRKGRATMKNLYKILFFTLLLAFSGMICFSQTGTTTSDSAQTVQKRNQSENGNQNQVQNKVQNQNRNQGSAKGQGNSQNAGGANGVKKVNSAKPDLSKAKGARPNIVRPSGSTVPKGAGKPGGAGRFGGR